MTEKISTIIKKRLKDENIPFNANDNISQYITQEELDLLQEELQKCFDNVLETLIIDTQNDENTKETSKRLAKMYLKEVFKCRYIQEPKITLFPNTKKLDEIITIGPLKFKSMCSHHFIEILGDVWIGVLPDKVLLGISKFARIVEWFARRPNIQEEAAILIADKLMNILKPKGLCVVIKASHHCMTFRGVENEDSIMVTSVMKGLFLNNHSVKEEFFNIIKNQKGF